jgi:twitching motility protein PilU
MDITPYLEMMVRHQASDLFFTPGTPVRIKIEGVIRSIGETPASPEFCRDAVLSILDADKLRHFESEWEVDFAIALEDRARFRVNAFHQRGQPAMVLRYIRSSIPTAEELGLPPVLTRLIMMKRGIILMVGATGSGKSTTLAAMIDARNAATPGHILTIEDPVEFVHPHKQCIINQREIGVDTKSYAAALKSSLREAPDVILIGEIRTRETMEAAIELAGTGHMAISTLHANNAHQALERIINMFPQELHKTLFLDLSLNMRAIISQRLVRTISGKRAAAIEVLINTPHIADLIRDGRVDEVREAMAASSEEGMKTFDDALLDLFRAGTINFSEALANADSGPNLEAKINFG